MGSFTARTAAVGAATIAVAGAGLINASAASASSGGGCYTADDAITACMATDRNDNLAPDLYVQNTAWVRDGCQSVRIVVRDLTANPNWSLVDSTDKYWCKPGHYGPVTINSPANGGPLVHGHTYMTIAWINNPAGGAEAKSPELHY